MRLAMSRLYARSDHFAKTASKAMAVGWPDPRHPPPPRHGPLHEAWLGSDPAEREAELTHEANAAHVTDHTLAEASQHATAELGQVGRKRQRSLALSQFQQSATIAPDIDFIRDVACSVLVRSRARENLSAASILSAGSISAKTT
jgi:hypothetical protein